MKFLKQFKWYEFLIMFLIYALLITLSIVFHSSWIIILNSLLGITTSFLLSKGIVWGHLVGIVQAIIYIYLSYMNAYYGEMGFMIIFSIPVYITSFITWWKNKEKGRVKVNSKLSIKEFLIVFGTVFALSFGLYYLLRVLSTANLLISTFSMSIAFLTGYLQIRRSEFSFVLSCISRVLVFSLWFSIVLGGQLNYIPTVVNYVIYFLLDIFGLIVWLKLKRSQNDDKEVKNDKWIRIFS